MKNSSTERSVEKDWGDSFIAICKTGGVTKKGRKMTLTAGKSEKNVRYQTENKGN